MASSLRMDQAVTSMAKLRGNEWKIIVAEPSVCISFKSKIHSRLQFTDLVVISVVAGPCFSFMASSLCMDQAVTSMAKLRVDEW